MKHSLICILAIVCISTSCGFFGGNHIRTEFFLVNKTSDTVEVISTARIAGPDPYNSTIHDIIPPGDTISMRRINTAKKFQLKYGVFNEMTIYRHNEASIKDPLDLNFWTQTLDTKKKKEFMLVVDSSFFKPMVKIENQDSTKSVSSN